MVATDSDANRAIISSIAGEVLCVLGTGRQVEPFSGRVTGFDLDVAYAVADEVRRRRAARGERRVGTKIGFTNRNLWDEYGVRSPIWGDMYDTTVFELADVARSVDVSGYAEPLIEPEIAFGLARTPEPGMDEAALMDCVDWIAHGFELVHSIFPGWRFSAADTVAGFGMHGCLLLGPRHAVTPERAGDWLARLTDFEVTLDCDGEQRGTGHAHDVLGGPVSALVHLVRALGDGPEQRSLAPGDIVTTGSLTLAFPVKAGEVWRSTPSGAALEPIEVRLA